MKEYLSFIKKYHLPRDTTHDDGWILKRDDWPDDYQAFLDQQNGCEFGSGAEDRTGLWATTPVPWNERPSSSDELVVLYGQRDSHAPEDRGWLTVTDVSMPRDCIAIGKFESSSLLVLSIRPADHGSLYYWDWYSNYPWRGDFYLKKLKPIYESFGEDLDEIVEAGESHPRHTELNEAANDALLVKLADSFSNFIGMLRVGEA